MFFTVGGKGRSGSFGADSPARPAIIAAKTRPCHNATACGRRGILSAGVGPGVFGSSRPRSPAGSVAGELDDNHWDGSRWRLEIFKKDAHVRTVTVWKTSAAIILGAIMLMGLNTRCTASEIQFTPKGSILYGDLVVRGVITDLVPEIVSEDNYIQDTPTPEEGFPITNVDLDVLEVIKGYWPDQRLRAIVLGGYPDGVPNDSGIIVDILGKGYGYSYNYNVGDEVILVLNYRRAMKGGSFVVAQDEGRYIKSGDEWVNQGTKDTTISLEEIRDLARSTLPQNLFEKADVVALGTVEDASLDTERYSEVSPITNLRRNDIQWITLRVSQLFKGKPEGPTIRFEMVVRGGDNLSWYRPVPTIREGEEWLCFLKIGPDGLFPFAGVNGLLKMDGDVVWRDNYIKCKYSRSELLNLLPRQGERDE
ncbi:MAG: hypothetical protein P8181_01435 [bacterium]